MASDLAFDAHRFLTAAPHYLQGRPPYAPILIRRVVQICGLDGSERLLDLGCGPGQIAFALAGHVREAVGIDPEPAMLALARSRADAPAQCPLHRGQFLRSRPCSRALPVGDDRARLPLDEPGRDPCPARSDDRGRRWGGAVQYRDPGTAPERLAQGLSGGDRILRHAGSRTRPAQVRRLGEGRGGAAQFILQSAGTDRRHRAP